MSRIVNGTLWALAATVSVCGSLSSQEAISVKLALPKEQYVRFESTTLTVTFTNSGTAPADVYLPASAGDPSLCLSIEDIKGTVSVRRNFETPMRATSAYGRWYILQPGEKYELDFWMGPWLVPEFDFDATSKSGEFTVSGKFYLRSLRCRSAIGFTGEFVATNSVSFKVSELMPTELQELQSLGMADGGDPQHPIPGTQYCLLELVA